MTPKYIIVHHTGGTDSFPFLDTSNYTFDQCNQDHRSRDFPLSSLGYYVGYQYYIDKNGTVHQARQDTEEGAHTNQVLGGVSLNKQSIGICMAGNFDLTVPTIAQENALKSILDRKMKEWSIPITNIVPHRRFAPKTCYGNKLPNDWAQKLVTPPVAPSTSGITSLIAKLVSQNSMKDYKGARDTASLLFSEFGKMV